MISPLFVTAEYHTIYQIVLSNEDATREDIPSHLVLRVAGYHLPTIKTLNEVAVISWVSRHTNIPVPRVVKYDETCRNIIGHEFILQEWAHGQTLSSIYDQLSEADLSSLIDQLVRILCQMHDNNPWRQIGGLSFGESGDIIVGQVIEETFWQLPDIERFWGVSQLEDGVSQQTVETLNIKGPFNSYVEYISAHLRKYVHAIKIHKSNLCHLCGRFSLESKY